MAKIDPVYPDNTAPTITPSRFKLFQWDSNIHHAAFIAFLFVLSMMHMDRIHEFIYFQF